VHSDAAHLPDHPYDVAVLPSEAGYLIGRVLPSRPYGPWWEYLETILDLEPALERARALAFEHHGRAWLFDETYVELINAEDAARDLP
jgi:hypothetical protein